MDFFPADPYGFGVSPPSPALLPRSTASGRRPPPLGARRGSQQPDEGARQQVRRNRAGRVRTVLTEKQVRFEGIPMPHTSTARDLLTAFSLQLNLLKNCYSVNPRPDALMKEQLVEMTGLSPRVVRVWFQNKRCKDKKKMAMKHQPEKVGACVWVWVWVGVRLAVERGSR